MRHPFRTLTVATVLFASAALAACGDDGSSVDPSDHPAGLLVAGDFDVTDYGSEASNLMFALQSAGYPLDTTSAMDSTSIAALLAGKDIVFMPEVTPTFDAGTQAILKAFVNNGGTIVLVGGYDHLDWVNSAFGWSLSTGDGWSERHPMPKAPGAAGTPYADGPASIPGNDGGSQLSAASLPDSGVAVYLGQDGDTDASVAILPSGSGRLVYFGWDWYDGAPNGLQDGGWRSLLRKSAGF